MSGRTYKSVQVISGYLPDSGPNANFFAKLKEAVFYTNSQNERVPFNTVQMFKFIDYGRGKLIVTRDNLGVLVSLKMNAGTMITLDHRGIPDEPSTIQAEVVRYETPEEFGMYEYPLSEVEAKPRLIFDYEYSYEKYRHLVSAKHRALIEGIATRSSLLYSNGKGDPGAEDFFDISIDDRFDAVFINRTGLMTYVGRDHVLKNNERYLWEDDHGMAILEPSHVEKKGGHVTTIWFKSRGCTMLPFPIGKDIDIIVTDRDHSEHITDWRNGDILRAIAEAIKYFNVESGLRCSFYIAQRGEHYVLAVKNGPGTSYYGAMYVSGKLTCALLSPFSITGAAWIINFTVVRHNTDKPKEAQIVPSATLEVSPLNGFKIPASGFFTTITKALSDTESICILNDKGEWEPSVRVNKMTVYIYKQHQMAYEAAAELGDKYFIVDIHRLQFGVVSLTPLDSDRFPGLEDAVAKIIRTIPDIEGDNHMLSDDSMPTEHGEEITTIKLAGWVLSIRHPQTLSLDLGDIGGFISYIGAHLNSPKSKIVFYWESTRRAPLYGIATDDGTCHMVSFANDPSGVTLNHIRDEILEGLPMVTVEVVAMPGMVRDPIHWIPQKGQYVHIRSMDDELFVIEDFDAFRNKFYVYEADEARRHRRAKLNGGRSEPVECKMSDLRPFTITS